MTIEAGTRLGPYEILSSLGAGGMGEVYRAHDTRLDREVAIKVLPEHLSTDEAALSRFEREAKALAALSHSNILSIFDVGREGNQSYVVMELLEGESLRARLRQSKMPWREALQVASEISAGLAAAHTKGIVHRDLKPENIFLTSDGGLKILDFGLAKVVKTASPEDVTSAPTVGSPTQPGTVLGTLHYMSPEQARGLATDTRSDIFSFGCVLYEMISGKPAFSGRTIAEVMSAILNDTPLNLTETQKDIPPELNRLIDHCLQKQPERRFQSASDLGFAIRSVMDGSRISQYLPAPKARWFRPAHWVPVLAVLIAVIGITAMRFYAGEKEETAVPVATPRIASLAVMPLENLSGDAEQEYFADGITEALIVDLSRISGLQKVISRASVMHYKGTKKPLPEIAQELKVDAMITGSVIRSGDRVRITAQMVEVSTEKMLWADRYERDLRDILALQDDVVGAIVRGIKINLTPEEEARMAETRPVNPEAHELFLKGRFYFHKGFEGVGFEQAIDQYKQAIEADPEYAPPYAELSFIYALLGGGDWGNMPPDEARAKALPLAMKALQLDENLAEAHGALGWIRMQLDWNWKEAGQELERAMELKPGLGLMYGGYVMYLTFVGRHKEAVRVGQQNLEVDPFQPMSYVNAGWALWLAGRPDEGIEQFHKGLELFPDFLAFHNLLSQVYYDQGKFGQAITYFEQVYKQQIASGEDPWVHFFLAAMSAKVGRGDETRRLLQMMKSQEFQEKIESRGELYPCYYIATLHSVLGERDQAFQWLNKAYDQHDGRMIWIRVDPFLKDLRSDPRFDDLVRRINFPA